MDDCKMTHRHSALKKNRNLQSCCLFLWSVVIGHPIFWERTDVLTKATLFSYCCTIASLVRVVDTHDLIALHWFLLVFYFYVSLSCALAIYYYRVSLLKRRHPVPLLVRKRTKKNSILIGIHFFPLSMLRALVRFGS